MKEMSEDNGNVLAEVEPAAVRRIHLVGVAGTGMGSFAGMLKSSGYEVTGSDEQVYPPMSEMLRKSGISVLTPYSSKNLDAARPDLVIIGNVIRRANPEAAEIRARRIPQMSFPAALGSLFLRSRHSIVVVGTHGKTTTSAMMGHILAASGRDPSFLVGGVTQNYGANFRIGRGEHFVVEGDEYDTAYFDKGPKFLHYRPRSAIFTSVELDHADIYRDLAHYEASFEAFLRLMPDNGLLAVSAAYPQALKISRLCRSRVVTYAAKEGAVADYTAAQVQFSSQGARFTVHERGKAVGQVQMSMGGTHNIENALGALAIGVGLGLGFEEIATALQSFGGVRRRQEVRAEINGTLILDDFAHHPTAVRETIAAVHGRYPQRRLWAVFEPRSNTSRRNIHQEEYAQSFDGADRASIRVPEPHDKVPAGEQLDIGRLVDALRSRGIEAAGEREVPALVKQLVEGSRSGDVILVMSNGSFGGFIDLLISSLRARAGEVS